MLPRFWVASTKPEGLTPDEPGWAALARRELWRRVIAGQRPAFIARRAPKIKSTGFGTASATSTLRAGSTRASSASRRRTRRARPRRPEARRGDADRARRGNRRTEGWRRSRRRRESRADRLREDDIEVGTVLELHDEVRLLDVLTPTGTACSSWRSSAADQARKPAGRPVPEGHAPTRLLLAVGWHCRRGVALALYVSGWGRRGATSVVALEDGFPIGAAWSRLHAR